MRTTIATVAGLLALTIFTGHAQAEEPPRTEPYPVELRPGELFPICKSGEVICPASTPLCDDIKVIDVVETLNGLEFKGIAPGETLCSVMSANKLRRVFRITVRP